MAYLILIRHGNSEYNEKGLWTGLDNPPLSKKGIEEAKFVAGELSNISLDFAYSAAQIRSIQTLSIILETLNTPNLKIAEEPAINERNYGIYTAKNKWQVKEMLGEEEFFKLRRGWDYPIPQGESLKQVSLRTVPFFKKEILPKLKSGKNVILVSSGNAIRTLIKHIENISDEEISEIELATGEAYIYEFNNEGQLTHKELRAFRPNIV